MIKLPLIMAVAVVAIAATACSPQQQAALQAPAVYQTVVDPNVSVQDKACTVLRWGMPIAQERVDKLTGKQLAIANGAAAAAASYCAAGDMRWQDRAIVAADTLSKVLWDVIK